MSSSTTKHQLTIPCALLPASQSLAAIHSARYRILNHSPLSFTHCSKCHSYLFSGNGHLRLVRSSSVRVLRRSCGECGHVDDTPVDRGNATLFTRTTALPPQVVTPSQSTIPVPAPAPSLSHSQSSTTTATPGQSKPRPKKRTGLQHMLSRNREKQDRDRAKEIQGQGGLASFLSSL